MILWGRASSVNVQKVLWGLDELGLEYEHKVVGGKYGGLDNPDYAGLTPVGRVPLLQDGDLAIWESHAILRHLARREGRLNAPESTVDMWMEFGSTTLQPPFIGLFWQKVRMKQAQQDAALQGKQKEALTNALSILDKGLADGRPCIAGDPFSMADVALGSLFYRITAVAPEAVERFAHIGAWLGRMSDREGYRKWVATSFEELRVTG